MMESADSLEFCWKVCLTCTEFSGSGVCFLSLQVQFEVAAEAAGLLVQPMPSHMTFWVEVDCSQLTELRTLRSKQEFGAALWLHLERLGSCG